MSITHKLKSEFTLANLISFSRPLILIYLLMNFKDDKIFLALMIIFVILLDALDGIVARHMKKKSKYGAMMDIIADRAVELIILFFYAAWGIISYIFPVIFSIRGGATDFLRLLNSIYKNNEYQNPLSLGKADGRFMRGLYGGVKLMAFSYILIDQKMGYLLMLITLFLNLYRGLPVIFSKRSSYLVKRFLS